jgi:bacillithiol system protein YtxJ
MGLFSFSSKPKTNLPWIELTNETQLREAIESSSEKPVLFFKHSTRCSISSMALSRFEENWKSDNEQCDVYFLDLLEYRPLSNLIAELTHVEHQSPQVIVLRNKEVIYTATHSDISASAIEKLLN